MENIRIHGNNKRSVKEKQKLRAAKVVYKDGIKPEEAHKKKSPSTKKPPSTKTTKHNSTRRDAQHRNAKFAQKLKYESYNQKPNPGTIKVQIINYQKHKEER